MIAERSFGDEEEAEAEGSGEPKEEIKIPEPTLEPDLQTFCKLVFNSESVYQPLVRDRTETHFKDRIILNALSEMNYDANKLPLGSSYPLTSRGVFADGSLCRQARKIDNLVRFLRVERTF